MSKILFFDNQDPEGVAVPEVILEEFETDYSQMIYDYITSQDNLSGTVQEEYYAAYTEKLDSIDTQLQQLNTNLEWILALFVFVVVLHLHSRVRGWITMLTGGLKDVH